jgi:LPXTG-motif cell wall-anchored protein
VDTEQGERITLEMSSGTMTPRDLGPGMTVRTEFTALENCRFRANRVLAVAPGSLARRVQPYANTREGASLQNASAAYGHSKAGWQTASYARPAAATSSVAAMQPMPGTSEDYFSSHPVISGRVLAVNDHRLVVQTNQGRKVALTMDSRSLVPRNLGPGSILRAEFRQMQDGRFYARRITLVGAGSANRVSAYAHTQDMDVELAGIVGDCGSVTASPSHTTTAYGAGAGSQAQLASYHGGANSSSSGTNGTYGSSGSSRTNGTSGTNGTDVGDGTTPGSDPSVASSQQGNGRSGMLPQTASGRPLLLLTGLLALGVAGLMAVARRRRMV